MKSFEKVKEEIIERAVKYYDDYSTNCVHMNRTTNKSELLNVITEDWHWYMGKVFNSTFLEESFEEDELHEAGIYTSGIHELEDKTIFACGSSTVKAYGCSVKACENSTVEACDGSEVIAYCGATVEAYGGATVRAYCGATVEAYGHSVVRSFNGALVKAYDFSFVKSTGNSVVEVYGDAYVVDLHGECVTKLNDNTIFKDCENKKIYIKKGQFEIIEVE
ncbi:hypothetical protein [Bacteroides heparinolyticus]|uniref:hypothetical protein n=1 Tax=Prevotella heparinolytica TaxID=28113 RepID=UPI003AEF8784